MKGSSLEEVNFSVKWGQFTLKALMGCNPGF